MWILVKRFGCHLVFFLAAMPGCLAMQGLRAQEVTGNVIAVGQLIEGRTGEGVGAVWAAEVDFGAETAIQFDILPDSDVADGLFTLTLKDKSGVAVQEGLAGGFVGSLAFTHYSSLAGRYRLEVSYEPALGSSSISTAAGFAIVARSSDYKPPEPPEPFDLGRYGEVTAKTVTFTSQESASRFRFPLDVGDNLRISTRPQKDGTQSDQASLIDTQLTIFSADDPLETALAFDDDSGVELFYSSLLFTAPKKGEYVIKVANLAGSEGLAVVELERIRAKEPEFIDLTSLYVSKTDTFERNSAIEFRPNDPRRLSWIRYYGFPTAKNLRTQAKAGDIIRVSVTSEELKPAVDIGFDTPYGFVVLQSSDEFDFFTPSGHLDFPLFGTAGDRDKKKFDKWLDRLRIRVSAVPGSTGKYVLTIEKAPEEPQEMDAPPDQ